MANNFLGSFTQQYISFVTEQVIVGNPGAQFGDMMVFVDSPTLSGMWNGTPPQPGEDFELNAQNYESFLTGDLLTKAMGFFQNNQIGSLWITAWDTSAPAYGGLNTAYTATRYDAYWKTLYVGGLGSENDQNAAAVALAQFAFADTGVYSQVGFGNQAADTLTAISGSLPYAIEHSTGDAVLVYSDPDTDTDPWLDQMGITLGLLNGSGTTIGNAVDKIATTSRGASGSDNTNLDPAETAVLTLHNIGWWMYLVGNDSRVVLRAPLTVKGNHYDADWFSAYLDYVCAYRTAEFLTSPATPQGKRMNNSNYQAVLGIINAAAAPFTEKGGIGIVDNFTTAVAPPFSQIDLSGTELIVPHAWQADYLSQIGRVAVQGTLFVQA